MVVVGLSLGLARVPLDWSSNLKPLLVLVSLNVDLFWASSHWGPVLLL